MNLDMSGVKEIIQKQNKPRKRMIMREENNACTIVNSFPSD